MPYGIREQGAWTNADSLSMVSLETNFKFEFKFNSFLQMNIFEIVNFNFQTNFSEIWIKIQTFSFSKMHLKMFSAKCQPFCSGLNVLNPPMTWGEFQKLLQV